MKFLVSLGALSVAAIAVLVSSAFGQARQTKRDQQVASGEATDFKVHLEDYEPPNETQVKTLLEGARAQLLPASGGRILFTDAKLSSFATNGALQRFAETPECVFDSVRKTISSAGILHVQTADRKLFLQGEGFLLQVTNTSLIISNKVHTIIRRPPGKSARK
jgi:hypothetical protein